MAAARGGAMVVKTGKRSNWRSRRRNQARGGSASEDTSDEDYKLGADDEVSTEDEDEAGELELSDEEDSCEQEEDEETSSEESELEDEDEDFVINPVRRKRKAKPQHAKKKKTKKSKKTQKTPRPPTKKRRSGLPRVFEEEDEKAEPKFQRRVKVRRRFGSVDEDEEVEDCDDVDFSPDDEEEEDDFDDEELEDEGEDEDEDLDQEEEEDEEEDEDADYETNDEEDDVFVEISVKRKNGSRKGWSAKGRKKRKSDVKKAKSGVKKRKRSKAKPVPKKRRRTIVSSDDEDDEDFVIEDELIGEEDESVGKRNANRSKNGNTRGRRLALEYDSADSYSSDVGGETVLDKELDRMVGLVQKPRTGLDRSKQEPKGKAKAEQDPPEKRICGVCLSEERKGHVIGLLNCCAHFFCFSCIMEWSKVESRCPVCKQRFTTITKTSGSDVAIQLRQIVVKVPKRDQVYQPSEEEVRGYLDPYANVVCIECQQGGEDTLMLLCDLCNSAAHTYCVGLGREVPEGDWYCDACRSADYEQSNVQNQETQNQQVTNGPELQLPQYNSNRTGRVDIDMNLPYIPSPERADTTADESYLRTTDSTQPIQVHPHDTGRGPRSARQSASTLSERRALHQRIHSMFSSNWLRTMPSSHQGSRLNMNLFRHPGSEDGQQSVFFNDLSPLTHNFL